MLQLRNLLRRVSEFRLDPECTPDTEESLKAEILLYAELMAERAMMLSDAYFDLTGKEIRTDRSFLKSCIRHGLPLYRSMQCRDKIKMSDKVPLTRKDDQS